MLLLARKNLLSERTRLLIAVGGVALSVFLISLLLSLYRGWDERVGLFVEESPVDVWIASQGASDFLTASSLLPLEGEDAENARNFLDNNPSVAEWSPLIVRPLEGIRVEKVSPQEEKFGKKMDLQFIGVDFPSKLGGPLTILEGKDTAGPSEVIVDEVLSSRYGVNVGDVIRAGGKDWNVVGKSKGGDFVFAQTVFTNLQDAQAALGMTGQTTFYALRLAGGADAVKFADDLELLAPQIIAFTRDEFVANTRERIMGNVLPILLVVLGLAFVVGLAVAGLTIYTATIEKAREYGILKAVGFKNFYLYRLVFEQSVATSLLGFLVGLGLTLIVGPFASDLVAQFVLFTRWQDVLVVAAATIVMAVIAAYIPVRRLAAIDPTAVFKA